jgi:tetratricopeptide (TPR) repeat protein
LGKSLEQKKLIEKGMREGKLTQEEADDLFSNWKKISQAFALVSVKTHIPEEQFQLFYRMLDDNAKNINFERRYKEGLREFKSAHGKLALPEEARKYFIQAETAYKGKQIDDAVDLYYHGLEAAPWYATGHYNLAILLGEQVGDGIGAAAEMRKFLELSPGSPDARAAQDKIYEWEEMTRTAAK